MLTNLLLIDIETVPAAESFSLLDFHRQALFLDKIAKTVPEDMQAAEIYRKKAGILAEFGKIICISTAFFFETENRQICLKIKSIQGNEEVEILRSFTELCDKMQQIHPGFRFAGHNIREFDLPFICRRMLINQLPLPHYLNWHEKKPWEVNLFDTLNWWKFGDNKNYISLHLLATILGIPTSKDDIDGSMVQDVYYIDQNLARIVQYCQKDIIVTARIILRFLNLGELPESRIQVPA